MSGGIENLLAPIVGRRVAHALAGPETVPSAPGSPTSPDIEESSASKSGLSFALRFLAKDKPALFGMTVIVLFLSFGLIEGLMQQYATMTRHFALGWLLTGDPNPNLSASLNLLPPSLSSFSKLFGTTNEGQSVISMILYAAPHDALASVSVVLTGVLIGMLVGIPAGYFGGWADETLMRITDAFLAFPFLVLAITFSVLFGNGFTVVLVVLYLLWWPTYARYFRGQTIALKNRGFVEASKLSGVGSFRIMFRHIFPNAIDPIIAQATLDFGAVLVVYSTLAFLGIGLQVNYPEWGAMTSQGLPFFPNGWWFLIFPGAVIVLIVVSFTLVGDRLQDLIGGRVTY